MRQQITYLLYGIFMLFFAGCYPIDVLDFPTDDMSTSVFPELILKDVSYGDHPQEVYDIYLPEGRRFSKTKVIVLIHGGGWRNGDKSSMQEDVDYLRNTHPDHAIVNLNYELAILGETTAFPNQYLDIQNAISNLTFNSLNYQILPQFGIFGRSSGAHLAMMYDYVYDQNDQVKFVANMVGPSDLTDSFYLSNPDNIALFNNLVDESEYPENADLIALNSPALVVNDMSSPTLMYYGSEDPLVPLTNAYTLNTKLTEQSNNHTLNVIEGNHGSNWSEEDIQNMRMDIDEYIQYFLNID